MSVAPITVPTDIPAADITAAPREFAILTGLQAKDGSISVEALGERFRSLTASTTADADVAKAVAPDGKVAFKSFVDQFKMKTDAPAGEGNTIALACHEKSGKLSPWKFDRRPVGPKDLCIRITHAGICHTDIHEARSEWGDATYPMVPGHEIAGVVVEVGSECTKFKVGDKAGVGCFVGSCGDCMACNKDLEQFCKGEGGCVWTYNYKHADGTIEHGGYSSQIVMNQDYTFKIAQHMPLDRTAPLLCAGITMYSPLMYYGLNKPGLRIGIAGLGGLGHMGVKLAVAMGCEVTVLSRGTAKKESALKLGAHNYLDMKDEEAVKAAAGSLDGIIDTISAMHDVMTYLSLLDINGKLVMVGVPPEKLDFAAFGLLSNRRTLAGSLIGGRKETQEMLDFCAENNVLSDVEVIKGTAEEVNAMYEKVVEGKVLYRAVIDIEGSFN